MNDQAKYTVTLEFETEGADVATKAAGTLQEAVDELGRQGIISTQDQNKYSRALSGTATSAREASASLPTLRYAMYDVAQTAGVMSAAIAATGTALLAASASYESAFTAVERTSGVMGAEATRLREDLIGLSREIPQSFGDIANLAARGAQLGIATQQIEDFTEVVAQFVATSDTVTLDQAVEAFGRISNLLGDTDFNRIGSSITLVGVNAAATEAQIVKTTQELAPFATAVGMSADEVIGLAAALGSLGQPPERARSAFLTLQRVMDTAIAEGSENLSAFATLLGQTEEQVAALWKQDPSQFVDSFAQSLGRVEDLTSAFAALGINERRAVQVFQALAADARNAGGGVSVLTRALQDSAQGYEEGSELARQYGLIVDDLASKWQIFKNAIQEFAATAGDALAPLAKGLLDIVTPITHFISQLTSTPAGRFFTGTAAAVGALVFVISSAVGSFALLVATLAAVRTGLNQVTLATGQSLLSFRALAAETRGLAVAMGLSTGAINAFKWALAATGIGLALVALGSLATAFLQVGASAEETFNKFTGSSSGLLDALEADTQAYREAVTQGNREVADSFVQLTPAIDNNTVAANTNRDAIANAATVLGATISSVDGVNKALDANTYYLGENTIAWMRNQLMQSQAFVDLWENQADAANALADIGFSFEEALRASAEGGEEALAAYYQNLANIAASKGIEAVNSLKTVNAYLYQEALASYNQLQGLNPYLGGNPGASRLIAEGNRASGPLGVLSKTMLGLGAASRLMTGSVRGAGAAVEDLSGSIGPLNSGLGDTGAAVREAREEVRTLVDYANDLRKVWDRAYDIRFSGQSTLDTITSSFISIREAADEAAKRIRDLNNDIRGLTSDISIQEYFLSIAVEYGDTKRAEAIEADLLKMRAELADKTADLQKEQDAATKSLTGNSKGAIENRKTISDLVQQYQAHIGALAASGMSQEQLAEATARLRQDFIQQATQLGYNRNELEQYAKAFDDVSTAIRLIPRNITVEANTNPAIQAFKEYEAQANRSINNIRNNAGAGISVPITGNNSGLIRSLEQQYAAEQARLNIEKDYENPRRFERLRGIQAQLQALRGWASGGFTGLGGRNEPAGIVHRGEYVIPKNMVNQSTGLPYADALGRLMTGVQSRSSAPAASSSPQGGVTTVALTAGTIQAIANATGKVLVLDGQVIADSSAKVYSTETTVGAY